MGEAAHGIVREALAPERVGWVLVVALSLLLGIALACTSDPQRPDDPKRSSVPQPSAEARAAPAAEPSGSAAPVDGVAVYSLSRGAGVPERARVVFAEARKVLAAQQERGEATALTETRLGIEGERLMCAEFRSEADAARTFARLEELCRGVDLIDLAREPCPDRAHKQGSPP